jgi:pyruvate dehydrogenase E2 component (dihydrolipoamide acetyltransferase)
MAFEFKLPDLGEGVAEGEVVKWLVSAGDVVAEDQPLAEVMTDKATVEIPSPRAGRIARLGAEEGETVPVGHVLVVIEESDEMATADSEGTPVETPAPAETPVAATTEAASPSVGPAFKEAAELLKAVEATPAVRSLARELGVSLKDVQGTGPRGRIVVEDVKRAAGGQAAVAPEPAAVTVTAEEEERIPLRGLRKRIAEAMTRSARNVPSFTFVAEADVTGVVAAREQRNQEMESEGVKLTFLAYVLKALSTSIRAYPYVNASHDDERREIILKKRIHIAVAVATPDGLTVPVIHDADQKNLVELAREVERLAGAARDNKLMSRELSGATFTVTTTGARGGVLATPMVHHPQVAILGVHAISKKPVVRDGEIVIRDMVNLSLSVDHRVIDGQVAADFLYDVVKNIEQVADGDAQ